jgi:hypothetical protein
MTDKVDNRAGKTKAKPEPQRSGGKTKRGAAK